MADVGALHLAQHARRRPVDLAVVGQHDAQAAAVAGRDAVGTDAADDDVVTGAGLDLVVAAHAGGGALDLLPGLASSQGEGEGAGLAAVAQDQVAAAAAGDAVGASAADDDVVACADVDGVVAALGGLRRAHAGQAAGGVEAEDAVVAQHAVVAGAAADGVAALAADDEFDAFAGQDGVGAAADVDVGRARDLLVERAGGVQQDAAVVAQHRALAGTGGDGVGANAAQHDAAAVAQRDGVVATAGRGGVVTTAGRGGVERARAGEHADGVVDELGVVAGHPVHAGTGRDLVAALAADDGLGAIAQRDGVVAALADVGALHLAQHARRRPVDLAVVGQHDVGTASTADAVGARAADDDFVACTQGDGVGATVGDAAALGLLQRGLAGEVTQFAAVAQDRVAAQAGGDAVGAGATHHGVAAVAHLDVVVAAQQGLARALAGEHVAEHAAGVPADLAVVAQHQVVTGAGGDEVGTDAGNHRVDTLAQAQGVGAAGGRHDIGALQQRQHTRCVVERTVVAQHGIGAAAGADHVGTEAADDDLVAVAGADAVLAPQRRQAAADLHVQGAGRVQLHPTVVAEDRVLAGAGDDGVASGAAQHGVVAIAERDLVGAAGGGGVVGAAIAGGQARCVVVELRVVAGHSVRASAGRDAVGTGAGDHGLAPGAERDAVVATEFGLGRPHHCQDAACGVRQHLAVVAQHDILPGPGTDGVATHAAQNDVVAVTQQDLIGIARGGHRVDAAVADRQASGVEVELRVVAGDDVAACTGRQAVAAVAADHDLLAAAQHQAVVAAQVAVRGADLHEQRTGRVQLHHAVVGDDGVLAGAGGDGVAAQAAQHGVVAVAQRDLVGGAGVCRLIGRAVPVGHAGGVVLELRVVARHLMLPGPGADVVGTESGDHPLEAGAQADAVITAQFGLAGRDLGKQRACGVHLHAAVVAQHRVLAAAGGDGVAAQAADHRVVAVAQRDAVGATGGCGDIGACVPRGHAGRVVVELRVVAGHRVAAGTGADHVGAEAGDHRLVAVAQHDVVVAAQVGIGGLHAQEHARRRPVDLAVVAQHGVGAAAATHGVGARAADDDLVAGPERDAVGAAGGRGGAAYLL